MIPPKDQTQVRAKASANACDLVDKLKQQTAELQADPRFTEGADLARSAQAAAEEVLRLLAILPREKPQSSETEYD